MKQKITNNENGVSTVFGSMLFLIIIIMLASTLFVALYSYNDTSKEAIKMEELRAKEKIVINELSTDPEVQNITAVGIKNVGSTATKVAAIYINNYLVYEGLVPIESKGSILITLPEPKPYNESSIITATTERGVRSTIEEGDLIDNYQVPINDEFYFGPLKLDYEEFYYSEIVGGAYDPEDLWQGWNPPKSTKLVWRITVTNVDARDILLSNYSCLTLIDNAGGSQSPWYIERVYHSDGSESYLIESQETVNIFYRWDNPTSQKDQSTFSNNCQCRVILTFFGEFELSNGRTIPYGQTIPFEAVLIDT
jgi:hypothetical protein